MMNQPLLTHAPMETETTQKMNYFVVPGLVDYPLTRLLYIVAEETGVPVSVIRSKDQSRKVADARHLFSAVAREHFGRSYQFLADFLHRTSHSTIKRSVSQALNYLETDRVFQRQYQNIKSALKALEAENPQELEVAWSAATPKSTQHVPAERPVELHFC
ncbi:MAG: helix-turn-helix domain-containing protein [Bacteroidota bacterium]